MRVTTFNFQFYSYKMPTNRELDYDDDMDVDMDNIDHNGNNLQTGHDTFTIDENKEIPKQPAVFERNLPTNMVACENPKVRFRTKIKAMSNNSSSTTNTAKAQHHESSAVKTNSSLELREKILEMSKRNSGSFADQSSLMQTATSLPTLNSYATAGSFGANTAEEEWNNGNSIDSVKNKIVFFNNILQPKTTSKFINLLKTTKEIGVATRAVNNNRINTPMKRSDGSNNLSNFFQSYDQLTSTPLMKTPTPQKFSGSSFINGMRNPTKSSTKRLNTVQNINGAKPQMHAAMEDLDLVVPVRLRVAEYERRISMA
ncbi:protein bottleneck [Teleopsis dalmanni]|uniref:protein bottleneck n=1 Tax=Teleopsis dalmanni TaxID=139649 RepID=UPI0018CD7816|nr:protein bottleneck [Teleopsis dalmanni]